MRYVLKLLQRFIRRKDGVLPVIFALTIVPSMALVGMAVDFAGARTVKARCNPRRCGGAGSADAIERLESEAGNENDFVRNETSYAPIKRGSDLFKALADTTPGAKSVNFSLSVLSGRAAFSPARFPTRPIT